MFCSFFYFILLLFFSSWIKLERGPATPFRVNGLLKAENANIRIIEFRTFNIYTNIFISV